MKATEFVIFSVLSDNENGRVIFFECVLDTVSNSVMFRSWKR